VEDELTVPLQEYMRRSGDSRSTAYEKIRDGRLIAYKDGNRLKIDWPHARNHLQSLPRASIRPVIRKGQTAA
jgi:hypothetical protein